MAGKTGGSTASERATHFIQELAAAQHGVVCRRQLVQAGIRPTLIKGRVANGRLIPIFTGVYALGTGSLSRKGRWTAVALRGGANAHLSHRSAASLHGLIEPVSAAIEAVRPASEGCRLESLPVIGAPRFSAVIRGTRSLPPEDRTVVAGIPVTSVARTLLDLASVSEIGRISSALTEADRLRCVSRPELIEVISRGKGWSGVATLRTALRRFDPSEAEARSTLEIAFLRLCREAGLPSPAVNTPVGPFVVDFPWIAARLVVEVDGYEFHHQKPSFRSDRNRDVDLTLAGYTVARFTYEDVIEEPAETATKLRCLLKAGE